MNPETAMRQALEEIIRMSKVPLNDKETEGSRTWRMDVREIANRALVKAGYGVAPLSYREVDLRRYDERHEE